MISFRRWFWNFLRLRDVGRALECQYIGIISVMLFGFVRVFTFGKTQQFFVGMADRDSRGLLRTVARKVRRRYPFPAFFCSGEYLPLPLPPSENDPPNRASPD